MRGIYSESFIVTFKPIGAVTFFSAIVIGRLPLHIKKNTFCSSLVVFLVSEAASLDTGKNLLPDQRNAFSAKRREGPWSSG